LYEANVFYLMSLGEDDIEVGARLKEIQSTLLYSPLGLVPPTARFSWMGTFVSGYLAFDMPFGVSNKRGRGRN